MNNRSRSSRTRGLLSHLRWQDRAATLVFTALSAAVLIGATALAVDLGMLISARVQSQRAADTGALAGASELAVVSGTEALARARAKEYSNKHNVLTNPVDVGDEDVDVLMDEGKVRVRVHHSVNTLFARIFGVDQVNVSTVAAAEVVPAGAARCAIPIAAIDRFRDHDGTPDGEETELNGQWDGTAEPAGEFYMPCVADENGNVPEGCTGFHAGGSDEGLRVEIKTAASDDFDPTSLEQTCQANTSPGWSCWIRPPGMSGAAPLKDIIRGCTTEATKDWTVAAGDNVDAEPGETQSLVKEFRDYINDNGGTDLVWDQGRKCVWDNGASPPDCVGDNHARIRAMPYVNPNTLAGSGSNANADVVHLSNVFLEKVAQNPGDPHKTTGGVGGYNVYVIIMTGASGGEGIGSDENSQLKNIVLVE